VAVGTHVVLFGDPLQRSAVSTQTDVTVLTFVFGNVYSDRDFDTVSGGSTRS